MSSFLVGLESFNWAQAQLHSLNSLHSLYPQFELNSHWRDSTASTQAWAKEELDFSLNPFAQKNSKSPVHIYFCNEQTAGRGRGQHTWTAPASGSSLLTTIALPIEQIPPPYLTLLVGKILITAAQATWPQLKWSLKKPNDLYIENKKVAGLLLETITQGSIHYLIVGLGLNVFNQPPQIETATFLQKYLKDSIELDVWHLFLTRFYMELSALFNNNSKFALRKHDIETLLYYMNLFPLLDAKYDESSILL